MELMVPLKPQSKLVTAQQQHRRWQEGMSLGWFGCLQGLIKTLSAFCLKGDNQGHAVNAELSLPQGSEVSDTVQVCK